MNGSTSLNQFPSFIDQELNIPPPGAIDNIDNDDDDGDSSRYELWTFRVPSDMNVSDLDGVEINLKAISKNSNNGGMKINDGKFALTQGDSVENKNLRVLVPGDGKKKKKDDSSSSSDDDDSENSDSDDDSHKKKKKKVSFSSNNKFLLHPSSKEFARHFNVNKVFSRKSEAQLAPRQGPESVDDTLRHAYCHIPQRTGLKRRWMPLGTPQTARDIPSKLVTLKSEGGATTTITSDDDDGDSFILKRSSTGGKKRAAGGDDTNIVSPKSKRIKAEKNSGGDGDEHRTPSKEERKAQKKAEKKSAKKSAEKKSAKKSKKSKTKKEDSAMEV